MHKLGRRETLSSLLARRHEHKRPTRTRPWRSYSLLVVLIVALSAVCYGVYLKWNAPKSVSNTVLALQAERRENLLRISWTQDTPVVNYAKDGVLSIRDGDSEPQELHLNREQLRTGTVVYSPANQSVQVRLEVTAQDDTKTSETILAGPAPNAHRRARHRAANRSAAGSSARKRIGRQASGNTVLADPPSQPTTFSPEAFALIALAQPKPPAPPPENPQQLSSSSPFVVARPVQESLPNLPLETSSTVTSEVEIQVKVQIDKTGRVVKVEPLGSHGSASGPLLIATEEAAHLWRFAPATRGNQPVASEVVLNFRYTPKAGGN